MLLYHRTLEIMTFADCEEFENLRGESILKWRHVAEGQDLVEFSYLHNGLMIYSLRIKSKRKNIS